MGLPTVLVTALITVGEKNWQNELKGEIQSCPRDRAMVVAGAHGSLWHWTSQAGEREDCWCQLGSSFYSQSGTQGYGMALHIFRVGIPTSINLV